MSSIEGGMPAQDYADLWDAHADIAHMRERGDDFLKIDLQWALLSNDFTNNRGYSTETFRDMVLAVEAEKAEMHDQLQGVTQ